MKADQYLNEEIVKSIEFLANKRSGGRVNIRGIGFQLFFSINKALSLLHEENISFRLEGIEDLDVSHKLQIGSQEYYQLKYKNRKLSALDIWKLKVIQNFLEVYIINPEALFYIIINQKTTDNNLDYFLSKGPISEKTFLFWQDLISKVIQEDKKFKNVNVKDLNLLQFLQRISIQIVDEESLRDSSKVNIIKQFSITNETYSQYLKILFYYFFQWARFGSVINGKDIKSIINNIKINISKGDINPAIQNNWLETVSFVSESDKNYNDYYEGKPGRPHHISLGLPVDRYKWEKLISEQVNSNDVTIIRSSSGQGKSTLAWKVCKSYLDENKYDIYELKLCKAGHDGAIVEYIKLCIEIGKRPLIVIDGLSTEVDAWIALANRLINEPVRILITAREEEWNKFKHDAFVLKISEIEIGLDKAEAKDIYALLEKKKLIHKNVNSWQSAWEKVSKKRLLIEYVFLITFGQMLKVRLKAQVDDLNIQKDSAAIIQALRMIALADKINIKIETRKLIIYLSHNYSILTDRALLLLPLEKEYYLRFDQKYIEGLHPVRSEHISEILHNEYVPFHETLLELSKIISEEYFFELAQSIFMVVDKADQFTFFKNIAKILTTLEPYTIVNALDGIWSSEALNYWKQNKSIFDSIYRKGGGLFLAMTTAPFADSDTFLNELNSPQLDVEYIIEAKESLPKFNFEESSLKLFIQYLHQEISSKPYGLNIGSGRLFDWFDFFNLKLPNDIIVKFDSYLWDILNNMPIEKSALLAQAIHKINPVKFQEWSLLNKGEIISVLKIKTNTLTIIDVDNVTIKIEYIVEEENYNDLNNESVSRARYVKSWLPIYEFYETNLILLSILGDHYDKYIKMEAHKTLSYKILYNDFITSINSIWNKVINNQYEFKSSFEWQKSWVDLREDALKFVKSATRILELRLELNTRGYAFNKTVDLLSIISKKLSNKLVQTNDLSDSFKTDLNLIFSKDNIDNLRNWNSALLNLVSQYSKIPLLNDSENLHITIINLKNLLLYLPKMQKSFDVISIQTDSFFETSELIKEENKHYQRLHITALYYIDHLKANENHYTASAREEVSKWWDIKITGEMYFIHSLVDIIEENVEYKIIKPNYILEEEYGLRTLVFGINDIDFKSFYANEFEKFVNLSSIAFVGNIEFTFIVLVFIVSGKAVDKGLRLNKDFLELCQKELEGEMFGSDIEMDSIIPKITYLSHDLLSPLSNPELLSNTSNELHESIYGSIRQIWEIDEFNTRINEESNVERTWYVNKKNKLDLNFKKFSAIIKNHNIELYNSILELYTSVNSNKITYGPQYYSDIINKHINENQ